MRIVICLILLLAVASSVFSADIDFSRKDYKHWPIDAMKYLPPLGPRTMSVLAPAYVLETVDRWNGGNIQTDHGYNSLPIPVIADVIDEQPTYYRLNPRRLQECCNSATGRCFNWPKAIEVKKEEKKETVVTNNTTTNNYYSYYSYSAPAAEPTPMLVRGQVSSWTQVQGGISEKVTYWAGAMLLPTQTLSVKERHKPPPPNPPCDIPDCPIPQPSPGDVRAAGK